MRNRKNQMRRVRRKVYWAVSSGLLIAAGCGRHSILPPEDAVEGWHYSESPRTYDHETLFHYIDGKARVYLNYGFVRLDHVQFAAPGGKPVIDVDVYDMGTPRGAFGIYSLERGEELPLQYKKPLGYMVGSARFFWKGRHYVAITSPHPSPQATDAINSLSGYVERSVPGDSQDIPLLAAFPQEGKVQESEQYFAADLLGHEFMGGGFVARYEEKGNRFRVFLSEKESHEAARKAYEQLQESLAAYGEVVRQVKGVGESAFEGRDNYIGRWLVSLTANYVAGAVGFSDEDFAASLLHQLTARARRLFRRRSGLP